MVNERIEVQISAEKKEATIEELAVGVLDSLRGALTFSKGSPDQLLRKVNQVLLAWNNVQEAEPSGSSEAKALRRTDLEEALKNFP